MKKNLILSSLTLLGLPGLASAALVAWYPLDGDANDASGNGHNGAVVGSGVTFGQGGANGATGQSTSFDGNGHIDVPWDAALNTQDFTITLWTNAAAACGGSFRSPITNRDDVAPGGAFRHGWIIYNNNAGNWSFWNGGGPAAAGGWNIADDGPVSIGTWVHVAITYDSATNTKTIYVDGVPVSVTNPVAFSPNNGLLPDGLVHENEDLHIGGGGDDGTQFRWDGCIDDVSLWNKALPLPEIEIIRLNGLPNPADLCLTQMDGTRAQPFNVDSFFDVFFDVSLGLDVLEAPLGPMPPDALPGPLMIDKGHGQIAPVVPLFPEVTFTKDHWAWQNDPLVPAFTGPVLTPLPAPPGLGETWFHSEPPQGGMMCIYIDGNWGAQSKITVSGRMRDHSTGKGYDQFSSGVMITGSMSAMDCAERICDVITCTWSQLAGVRVLCIPEPFGNNGSKITLLFENGSIDWGDITICVTNMALVLTYDDWKIANGVIDDDEDLDFDGIPAIVEAYLGLNPKVADSIQAAFDRSGLIAYQKDPNIVGLVAVVETSTNLLDFDVIAVNPPSSLVGDITLLFPPLGERGFWRFGVRRW